MTTALPKGKSEPLKKKPFKWQNWDRRLHSILKLIVQLLSILAGLVSMVLISGLAIVLLPFVYLRIWNKEYYVIDENKRSSGASKDKKLFYKRYFDHSNENKRRGRKVNLSVISGIGRHWEIEFNGDGEEGSEVQIQAGLLFFEVYITFANFFPDKWFPLYNDSNGDIKHWGKRSYGMYFYEWATWFSFWRDDSGWNKDNGLFIVTDFKDLVRGKHSVKWEVLETKAMNISLIEGLYELQVIKKLRTDSWQRWFSSKMISWEVIAGVWIDTFVMQPYRWYKTADNEVFECKEVKGRTLIAESGKVYQESEIKYSIKETGVAHPGKGTASYNCGETATFSLSTGNEAIRTFIDAANAFQNSVQADRLRHGGKDWKPKGFEGSKVEVINK